jgi:hypothetical protein
LFFFCPFFRLGNLNQVTWWYSQLIVFNDKYQKPNSGKKSQASTKIDMIVCVQYSQYEKYSKYLLTSSRLQFLDIQLPQPPWNFVKNKLLVYLNSFFINVSIYHPLNLLRHELDDDRFKFISEKLPFIIGGSEC